MAKRTIYFQNGPPDRPSVRISKTSEGVMFAVHATGRSLNLARIRAEKCYRALAAFVAEIERPERERGKLDAEIAWRGVVKEQEKA